jgi:hypothetical protein
MTIKPAGRTFELTEVQRNDTFASDAEPVQLPEGEALALRIRRVPQPAVAG